MTSLIFVTGIPPETGSHPTLLGSDALQLLEKKKKDFCLDMVTVADLEGVRVVRLNPPLAPNYFNFMGKFMKNQVKC